MQNAEVKRGLQRAGFVALPAVALGIQRAQNAFNLSWNSFAGRFYQVEYSPDLFRWAETPGLVQGTNAAPYFWQDSGPPKTISAPMLEQQRFYQVFQLGLP